MSFRSPITTSDFRKLRENRQTYVDKTASHAHFLAAPEEVVLFPRPRRFGKTLWLSTLRAFVERRPESEPEADAEEKAQLFGDLAIWRDPAARAHAGRHPVVALTFKDLKTSTWSNCLRGITSLIANAFIAHGYLRPGLTGSEARDFDALFNGTAEPIQIAGSLRLLTAALHRHWGERAVLLIDEYDLPIHAAYHHGYYQPAIELFRNLLSGGFKDNPHLFKGVLTGILRVAKESIFSGLNNLAVYSLLRTEYADSFGFTEPEVEDLIRLADAEPYAETLRAWYNGYIFGRQVIYNPWSVLQFLSDVDKAPRPHWIETSANELIRDLIIDGRLGSVATQEALIRGATIEQTIVESVALRDLELIDDAVWSLLLFSGYLTATELRHDEDGTHARLRIPNREVRSFYTRLARNWLHSRLGGRDRAQVLIDALLAGDADTVERCLERLLLDHVSHHDLPRPARELPYHMFVLGLLVGLAPAYEVWSNRESGHGRADVLVVPRQPGHAGVVIELKQIDPDRDHALEPAPGDSPAYTPEHTTEHRPNRAPARALSQALEQIAERDYGAQLRARGAAPIYAYAAVFDRKRAYVRVRTLDPDPAPSDQARE